MKEKEDERTALPDDLIRETDSFWEDPKRIMALIDLLFLWDDPDRRQVVS